MKKSFLMPLGIFIIIFCMFYSGFSSISEESSQKSLSSLETAINRSIVHCYAVEGRYPESLSYLEEHYGITYDKDRYIVDYEIISSNLKPSVTVIPRPKGDDLF